MKLLKVKIIYLFTNFLFAFMLTSRCFRHRRPLLMGMNELNANINKFKIIITRNKKKKILNRTFKSPFLINMLPT